MGGSYNPRSGGSGVPLPSNGAVLSTAGSDTTGTVGNGGLPFLTAAAAYNAGARHFVVMPRNSGNYGGLQVTGGISISLFGFGQNLCNFGAIIADDGGSITVRGNGRHLVRCSVDNNGTMIDGAGGVDGVNGGAGHVGVDAGQINCYGVTLDFATSYGGAGGSGAKASADPDSNGGPGGAGGAAAIMTFRDCEILNAITIQGGVGGAGGAASGSADNNGGDGGAGGFNGEVHLINTIWHGSMAGAWQSGGGAGGAAAGSGGAGTAGTPGTPRLLAAQFSTLDNALPTDGTTTAVSASFVEGVFSA